MDLIERARRTEYRSSGRNPFSPVQAPQKSAPSPNKKTEIPGPQLPPPPPPVTLPANVKFYGFGTVPRSEEHTSELQSRVDLVCRLLLEKKKKKAITILTSCA